MSVETFDPSNGKITMTESAIRHFEGVLANQPGKVVRLATQKSGCSGYAYLLELEDDVLEGDIVFRPSDKVTLAVANDAIAILNGTEIDMVKEGVNKVVKFNNPNVVAECGCGESFTVASQ